MMGSTHAATGLLAGLLLADAVGLTGFAEIVPFAVVTAGYALVPDLDHPSSSATRQFGLLSSIASGLLRLLSFGMFRATRTHADGAGQGTHRHLTHTLIFALALGGLCTLSTALGGSWAVTVWLALGVLLAAERFGRLTRAALLAGAVGWLVAIIAADGNPATAAAAALEQSTGWLGIAVATGCLVHCLGDAVTESGCPILWPIPIKGERWYDLRLPRALRLRTDSMVERFLIYPAVMIGCLIAIPGVANALIALHLATTA